MSDTVDWRARALAAEQTVTVLKAKVRELYNGGGSTIQRTLERTREREADGRRRQERMATRNAELSRLSERLDTELQARVRDIRTILDNVVSGFFIVGPDGRVRDGFTASCSRLLGRADLAGLPAVVALGLDARRASDFEAQMLLLFDDMLPDEVVLAQLPTRTTAPDGRTLHFEGRAVRDEQNLLIAALFTVTDATALQAAERENAHYRTLVALLREQDTFDLFLASFKATVAAGRAAITRGDVLEARRAMHTLKGDAGCFGLVEIVASANRAEGAPMIDTGGFDEVEASLDAFLQQNRDLLRGHLGGAPGVHVTDRQIQDLLALAPTPSVHAWVMRARRRPVGSLLGAVRELVLRLAARCDKLVDLTIEGGETPVDPAWIAPVVRELGHLVRNAVDHGIEAPDERGDKPTQGQLRLTFADHSDRLTIDVRDDGRGINVARVRARAMERGLLPAERARAASPAALLELVFADGLSTAEQTTDISGRGVGMAAVRAAVLRMGGRIQIASTAGLGTHVHIELPYVDPRARRAA